MRPSSPGCRPASWPRDTTCLELVGQYAACSGGVRRRAGERGRPAAPAPHARTTAPLPRRYRGQAAGSAARPRPGGRGAGALLLPRRPPRTPTEHTHAPPRRAPQSPPSRCAPQPPAPGTAPRVTVSRSRPSRRRRRARPVPEKSASAATSALHTRITQERRRRSRPGSTCLRRGCCPASPSLMVRERAARGGGADPPPHMMEPAPAGGTATPGPPGALRRGAAPAAPGPCGRRGAGGGGRSSPARGRGRGRSAAAPRRSGRGARPARGPGRPVAAAAAAGEPARAVGKGRGFSAAPCLALPSTHIVRAGLTQSRLHLARPPRLSPPLSGQFEVPAPPSWPRGTISPSRPVRRALFLTSPPPFLLGDGWRAVTDLHAHPDSCDNISLLVFFPKTGARCSPSLPVPCRAASLLSLPQTSVPRTPDPAESAAPARLLSPCAGSRVSGGSPADGRLLPGGIPG